MILFLVIFDPRSKNKEKKERKEMGTRSKVFLGKYVFVKYIELTEDVSNRLKTSLETGDYSPFDCNEFLASYLLSEEIPELVSPGTLVLSSSISSRDFSYETLEKYKNKKYNDFLSSLTNSYKFKEFSPFSYDDKQKTILILSDLLTGNFREFLENNQNKNKGEDVRNALIHISYLLFRLEKDYKSIHGDSKLENYTWRKLDNPIDYTYDFRTLLDNSADLVFTLRINHLFYLTDLEFIHSLEPFKIKSKTINFTKVYDWMSDDKSIFVPKLSAEEYYDFRNNLFEGYHQDFSKFLNADSWEKQEEYMYTRMFSIDLLLLIKILLTRDYSEQKNISPDLRRKLNIYFANYCAISQREIDPQLRYTSSYKKVSPEQFAFLLS